MEDSIRDRLKLSQERLAGWLGTSRSALAMAEAGHRLYPRTNAIQEIRLHLSVQGLFPDVADPTVYHPAEPLPYPAAARDEVETRLLDIRRQATLLRYQLRQMQRQAPPYELRLTALGALRAYQGPTKPPENSWLAWGETIDLLQSRCGRGPQAIVAARLAGVELEITQLEALLATLPAAEPR